MAEKRRLLDFVFSNSAWRGGKLAPNFWQPFDMLAVTAAAYRHKKAAFLTKNGQSEIWLLG